MKRWQCTLLCLAIAPIVTVTGALLLSGPILELYEAGRLGTDPTWPLIHITCGGLTFGSLAAGIAWWALRYTRPEERPTGRHTIGSIS